MGFVHSIIHTWGSTQPEREQAYPCDRFVPAPNGVCFRAIDVAAPVPLTFAWLCQLRVAPYSYDWLDNFGRRSPRLRDSNLTQLALGQPVMRIFRLRDFAPNDQLTAVIETTRVFGKLAITYRVRPRADGSRIVVKMVFRLARCAPMRFILPPGDLFMMHKQLRTLKHLAEREHARCFAASGARATEATSHTGTVQRP